MRLTKNFRLSELDCKDGSPVPHELYGNAQILLERLQVIRDNYNMIYNLADHTKIEYKIEIISGYRTELHNKNCGGKKGSFHLACMAADMKVYYIKKRLLFKPKKVYVKPKRLYDLIESLIEYQHIQDGGLGKYKTFTHYDIRDVRARW